MRYGQLAGYGPEGGKGLEARFRRSRGAGSRRVRLHRVASGKARAQPSRRFDENYEQGTRKVNDGEHSENLRLARLGSSPTSADVSFAKSLASSSTKHHLRSEAMTDKVTYHRNEMQGQSFQQSSKAVVSAAVLKPHTQRLPPCAPTRLPGWMRGPVGASARWKTRNLDSLNLRPSPRLRAQSGDCLPRKHSLTSPVPW